MIRLNDIVVKFGDFTALHSINVHVKEGEFFTFLPGPLRLRQDHHAPHHHGLHRAGGGLRRGQGRDITPSPSRTATSASCSRATRSSRR